ncbi:Type I restriction modification DNA specificity domain protein [Streptococcus mitis]|jgi:type I restriction-modification system specificity subunit|uniref:Type I restriction modification DNA specificity domain protein n=1 Tax=Streptococcus mitis TaxID=28037 RepID=A0A3R9JNI8_STRMT|nr:restriction endonuclease subunit S [Streptococcus mitis]RSI78496.1 Type I restriction modification DNA specificity domain protein [Streptococcus mitis]
MGKIEDYFELNPSKNTNNYTDYINYIDTSSATRGILHDITYLDSNFPSRANRCVKYDDILYSSVRPNLRHYYHYKLNYGNVVASTGYVLLRNKNKELYSSEFLYYFLVTDSVVKYLSNIAELSQSTFPSFSAKDLGKIELPAFDFIDQKKIADILTTYDDLIENNNKRIKLLEQMAENLYKEWFVRFRFPGYENVEFENGIPKGWEVKKIKNCVKRLPFNQLYKRNELESEGKVIVIDQSSAEFLGYHNDEPSHCASIDKPILLFGDHSCKFVLMIRDFSLGENVVPFISENENKLNDYYLFYAVHKIIVTEEYKRHWGRFTTMKILVPNYELQLAFADFIRPIIQEQNNLWNETQLLIKQRDVLLPRLMSGKLEV